ncbi:MAG: PmoA family protein [Sphingobacterium sp.]
MNYRQINILALIVILNITGFKSEKNGFAITENKADKRVDITIDGQPFTSYIYPESLMKPVLYPLRTSKNTLITRGWPFDPRPGERVDHPHHVGLWFNYGDVNGLDFWNNSTAIPAEKKNEYGTIVHASVNKMEATSDHALLDVTKYWQKPDGTNILKEDTRYLFSINGEMRTIELTTKLTALKENVSFKDNKEGLLGIRLARELEHPSNEPVNFTDANGNITEVAKLDNSKTTGKYRSSEGIEGDDVWGTRGKWVNLTGKIDNESISLVIIDHPDNIGYPTYWHARGYGLFAANPLGQNAMSGGKETLNFSLQAGKSIIFKYKILINSGSHLTDKEVNAIAETFAKEKS